MNNTAKTARDNKKKPAFVVGAKVVDIFTGEAWEIKWASKGSTRAEQLVSISTAFDSNPCSAWRFIEAPLAA